MSPAQPRARELARLERLCDAATDSRALRLEAVELLRRCVRLDAYAWPLTDPVTAVGTAPVADVPWLAQLPRQIRLKYLTEVNRWTALGDVPVGLLHAATGGDLARSLVWREMLAEEGVADAASLVLRDRYGCWAFLELWRLDDGRPFTSDEGAFLAQATVPLTRALRRLQAETFVERPAGQSPGTGPVVLLLSPELEVRSQTPQTQEYLRLLVPPAAGRSPVPASAYNVAAQLLAQEAGVHDGPAWARVHLQHGEWVTLRAARLAGASAGDIAVTIDRSAPAERADLFARAHGLSPRERELLLRLVAGGDTREIARELLVTQNTVQDHLKSVFAKTSVRSRRTLLSRVLGT